jgi:hypothetical protein
MTTFPWSLTAETLTGWLTCYTALLQEPHYILNVYVTVDSLRALSTTLKAPGNYSELEKGLWDLVSV